MLHPPFPSAEILSFWNRTPASEPNGKYYTLAVAVAVAADRVARPGSQLALRRQSKSKWMTADRITEKIMPFQGEDTE